MPAVPGVGEDVTAAEDADADAADVPEVVSSLSESGNAPPVTVCPQSRYLHTQIYTDCGLDIFIYKLSVSYLI